MQDQSRSLDHRLVQVLHASAQCYGFVRVTMADAVVFSIYISGAATTPPAAATTTAAAGDVVNPLALTFEFVLESAQVVTESQLQIMTNQVLGSLLSERDYSLSSKRDTPRRH
jgi:hypothetical protein